MRDIAFQCPECSKNLAVGNRFVGVVFACPDCRVELKTPQPEFVFPCPSCGCVLFAPRPLRGEIYGCPDCETPFEVPALSTLRCGSCGVHIEVEDEWYPELAGTAVECPQCQAQVEVPVLPKPVIQAAAPAAPPSLEFVVRCRGCSTDVRLEPRQATQLAGKLIRCPKCKRFLMVPKEKPRVEEMAATRRAQAPKVMNPKEGTFARTMRLDDILETIPQARLLQEGLCIYCNKPLRQLDERSYVCENCWRIVRTVRRR